MPHPPDQPSPSSLSEAHAQAILRASLDAMFAMDAQGRFLEVNSAGEAMLGRAATDLVGRSVAECIRAGRDRTDFQDGVARYLANGGGDLVNRRVELPILRADGAEFPAEIAIIAPPGDPQIFFVFVRDISRQKKTEAHADFLLKELAHRGKNLLAVVQSIVNRTLRDHPAEAARQIIVNRIGALARSHAYLASNPSGAPLRQIVEDELEGFSSRVVVKGPEVHLTSGAAQTMALIVHELATNAVKYGALSGADGCVHVRWSGDGVANFSFEWRESDGPAVTPPTRVGFGRTVLERIAAAEFNTTPDVLFAPEGLVYRFDAALGVVGD